MENQGPNVARNSKTRVIQPQLNQAPAATPFMTPESALLPSMLMTRDNTGGQSQQDKTPRAGVQGLRCQKMGPFASKYPQRLSALPSDSIPEATLIATITPAAGGKTKRRILSQLYEYRSLGLPISQETIVHQSASLILPNSSI